MTTNAPRSDDRMHTWRRWSVIGLTTAACVLGVGDAWTPPPVGTAIAGECFQKGAYMPPPCTATPNPGGANTVQQAVPDSGLNACQNQAAMATSLGLIPMICAPTVPGQPN
jgi:hypothetical protein